MQATGAQNDTSLLSLRVPIHWDEAIWEVVMTLPLPDKSGLPITKGGVVGDCA